MLDKIPSNVNLLKRKVLQSEEEVVCKLCGLEVETSAHLVLTCSSTVALWWGCYQWIGIQTVLPNVVRDHMLRFDFGWGKH